MKKITGLHVKSQNTNPQKSVKDSVITKSIETSSQEIIKNDEAMFSQFEPKQNRLFIAKIHNQFRKEIIPSYCIKSISRPMFVKKFFGFKIEPTEISFYDPIYPFLGETIQTAMKYNDTWNITLNVLSPVGDIVEQWNLTDAKILCVEYSRMNWCNDNVAEIRIRIQSKNAKLTTK